MNLETKFWRLVNEENRLNEKRLSAIKKWNVAELDRLDSLIKEKKEQSNLLLDKMINDLRSNP